MAIKKKLIIQLLISTLIAALIVAAIVHYKRSMLRDVVKHFAFSTEGSLKEWKEKIFKGHVKYSIKKADHESFVLATSKGTASALYYKIRLDMKKGPVISWKWNAQMFPAKDSVESLKDAKTDDFAARVYVIFPALFFTNSRALEYIWTEKIKEGTIAPSPYSKNLQLIVAESGKKENPEWIYEERDIYSDYVKAFGEEPKYDIGSIAFMTDADSTRSMAETFYDEIKIGYKKEGGHE